MHQSITTWLKESGFLLYKEFVHLNIEESKLDPEDDPYKSKYKAREIIKSLKCKLEDLIEDAGITSSEPGVNVIGETITPFHLLCALNYELAVNYVECEEVPTGQEYLDKCLLDVKGKELEPFWCTLSITINNQYGILWSNRCSYEEAYNYLKVSEKLYTDYKALELEAPLDYKSFWVDPSESQVEENEIFFESLHTHTLYYLAQAYGIRGDTTTSSKYCHITLARQMEMKQYEALDWSLNCATLSQYYVTQDQYNFARYCLACAELVNKEVFVKFKNTEFEGQNEREQTEEKMLKSEADVFRCWAKYGLNLLTSAHSALSGVSDDEITQKPINSNMLDEEHKDFKDLRFKDLEVSVYEERVTDKLPTNYEEAKRLYQFSIKCLDKAKEFYKLDGYVSAYVEITQDVSQLYKSIALFDDNFDNRCKMHKRRIDMLNAVLLELNPQHFLVICRQLTFEIAEIYGEMANLKKAIIEENPAKFSANSVKKINHLLMQSVKYYQGFVDSYMKQGVLPDTFEEDDVRGILMCYFYMARLNSKYYTNDKQVKLAFLQKEKANYEYIVNYCDNHPEAEASGVFKSELDITREMLGLFHAKLNNVLDSM